MLNDLRSFGKFCALLSLDKIPQLWNVLTGNISSGRASSFADLEYLDHYSRWNKPAAMTSSQA